MNHIRAKITPTVDAEGRASVRVDWLDIAEGEQVRGVLFTETFDFGPEAQAAGTGYVSRVAIPEADVRPGTFAVEAGGRRHYVVDAEAGRIEATGNPLCSAT